MKEAHKINKKERKKRAANSLYAITFLILVFQQKREVNTMETNDEQKVNRQHQMLEQAHSI